VNRLPTALPADFLVVAGGDRPVRLFSLPDGATPAVGPGALRWGSSQAPLIADRRRPDLPGSWGTLLCLCPALRPR